MLYFLLIVVGILTFMSRKHFMLSYAEHNFFYNLRAWSCLTAFQATSIFLRGAP